MTTLNRYIIQIQSSGPSVQELVQQLNEFGIELDEEYGLIPLNAGGEQSVGRVLATEDAVHRAEQTLPISFFPDLDISSTAKNQEK